MHVYPYAYAYAFIRISTHRLYAYAQYKSIAQRERSSECPHHVFRNNVSLQLQFFHNILMDENLAFDMERGDPLLVEALDLARVLLKNMLLV